MNKLLFYFKFKKKKFEIFLKNISFLYEIYRIKIFDFILKFGRSLLSIKFLIF
jgi:hypothetical protein